MAKRKITEFITNFSYSFIANILSVLISAAITFILPRLISVEQYGYYQLYIFYASYVGISYLGFCDGIYLRIGGKHYGELDSSLYSAQFRLLGIYEIVFYSILYCVTYYFVADASKHFVIGCVCIAAVGMCLRWFITFILQATNRIRENAIVTISERIIYIVISVPVLLAGYRDFELLILLDVAAKYISLLIGVWYCRDIARAKAMKLRSVLPEVRENISVGFRFMMAEVCDMLIIGVVRFGVQSYWDVETFSKVSVTLQISNFILTAINAIAVVIYPALRRTDEGRLPMLYGIMRITLTGFAFGAMIFYYPLQKILTMWLPQYAQSLRYTAILFPICVYQSKMSMLVNTYYKTLRLESLLMKCNIAALALSVACTAVSTLVLHRVMAAYVSILVVLVFRCILSEVLLSKHIEIKVGKDIVIELFMTLAFIICNWFFGFTGMLVYAGFYLLYILIEKSDICQAVTFVKAMV